MKATLSGRVLVAVVALGIAASSAAMAGGQQKGRYKKQGDKCVWDAADSGPNQCTPQTKGRFKRSGETCVWDAGDSGADQCRPVKGRFKKEGQGCVWASSDSGPDQCDPRRPK